MTFITVIVWTSLEVYHVHVASTIPSSLKETIEPLNPTLNTGIVSSLKSRYDETTLPKPVITQPPQATKSAGLLTPTPTRSLILTPTVTLAPTLTINP